MNKKTLGMIVGAAAGVGAALWFFRKKQGIARTYQVKILLKKRPDGTCGVVEPVLPDPVVLSRSREDEVEWLVENPETTGCAKVRVCIAGWKKRKQVGDPPVDSDSPVKFGLFEGRCETVKSGEIEDIKAKAKKDADTAYYEYWIVIDDEIALDPIVRIID